MRRAPIVLSVLLLAAACSSSSNAPVTVACTDCLTGTLSWSRVGGMVPSDDASSLAACRTYTHTRGAASCSTDIGACGAPSPSIGDVENALAQPAVVSAFGAAQTQVFGRDDREVDGTVLRITRDGKSLDVGSDCDPGGSSHVTCHELPAAIRDLAKLLASLDTTALATPSCAALK